MPSSTRTPTDRGSPEAERRQLTVMFCDLVDSTMLAERLDPEEYRDVVDLYQRTCEQVIERFEGRVAQYLGDGLLVYFGYPQAHEDDARRAVHSALGILEALAELNRQLEQDKGVTLAARLGIHTGLVVVGEMGRRQEQLAVGEAPNVAARLQARAEPDTVVISAATHRLVQGLFACHDQGLHTLKGLSVPLRVYRVTGESGVQSRFEVTSAKGLNALIGREREVEQLREAWTRAKHGLHQVMLLSGEAGIGKSRLLAAVKDHVALEPHILLECRCSPYYQQTMLYPVLDLMQRRLAWRREHSPVEKLQKLEEMLAQYDLPLAEVVPLFAALLGLPLPGDRYPPLTLTPQRQRARTLEAVVTEVRFMAAQRPVLLIVEDLHWADPTTLELLGLLLTQGPTIRLLTLLTFRPEFQPPWEGLDHQSFITLTPLDRDLTVAMIMQATGGKRLPALVLDQLVANTDGNPLFVEELTKTVLESGLLKEVDDQYELTGALPALAIPTTLHDSLIARLDRLGPAKAVAQLGATLGRAFPYELLQAVSTVDAATLDGALARLVEAGLLYEQGSAPLSRYLFKHALIQEAAYQSLLRSTRQQYHHRIAQTLAEKFPDIAETQPELLAQHYTEAGLVAEAIPWWQRAGQRAVGRSANLEAISHLTKGLELLAHLPESPNRIQQELGLLIALGTPLIATRGQSAHDVEEVFGRARELCRQLGEHPQLFTVLRGLQRFYQARGDCETAYELGEQLLRLAERVQDSAFLLEAHYALGAAMFWLGELPAAHEHFERVIALYDRRVHHSHVVTYGNDPEVVAYSYTACTLLYLGYPEQSERRIEAALALAREMAHPYTLAYALAFAGALYYFRREHQPTRALAEQAIALSNEHGFPFWLGFAVMLRGWALAREGQTAEGIAQLRQGLVTWRAMGNEASRENYLSMLAEALACAGEIPEGLAVLDEAVGIVRDHADRLHAAVNVYHVKGELLVAQGRQVEGEAAACFERAIDLARRQGAKLSELRVTTSLHRLLQSQGKGVEARPRLAAIYGWFTEGFEIPDLRAARELLDER